MSYKCRRCGNESEKEFVLQIRQQPIDRWGFMIMAVAEKKSIGGGANYYSWWDAKNAAIQLLENDGYDLDRVIIPED